jgi:peptidoglycan/LPS O-acetylase OafA/YrhL
MTILNGDFLLGIYLVLSGFLVFFVLFLRSGPLLQQTYPSEKARLESFAGLSANFILGRWLRLWPALQVSLGGTYLWARYLAHSASAWEAVVSPCGVWEASAEALMVSNLAPRACFSDLWTVSLLFQLSFLAPVVVYLFHRRRSFGYSAAWLLVFSDLALRTLFVYLYGVDFQPTMAKRPWFRMAEFSVGMMLCMSFVDRCSTRLFRMRPVCVCVAGKGEVSIAAAYFG